MPEWTGAGKLLIAAGVVLIVIGLLVLFGVPFSWFGKLPGDVVIKRDRFSFYAPITTSLVISILLSLLLYILSSFWRR
jgi:hypothetical protein